MAIFDRLNIKVIAVGAGLCGVALAMSAGAAAAPMLKTGGAYECVETQAGEAPAAGAPAAAPCAPITEMAGVPMALPGPVPIVPPPLVPPIVPPPLVPPVPPLVPPVPIVPPIAGAPIVAGAPVAGGLPLTTMGGAAGGKGDPVGPAPSGAPQPGQPIAPGPGPSGH
ncbi:hypothetical protein H7J93_10615 [Mycobacterium barrassiae]|uniref:hypothetical protein n=1 Tax=Mycobacterium barrassiae TaxID=319709 RepID=UPI002265CA5A|nr:hypothetical protein [Mycobacterium barrassiae]MCV7300083.1 hypothetical protein [Mycobacterium barrassiae]